MNVICISSLLIFIFALVYNNKSSYIFYIKKAILPLLAILFIAALIIFPKTAVASASKGIHLWLDVVFPSLFPFFVASQLLSKSGFINVFGVLLEPIMRPIFNVPGCGSFALAMGIVSGYPVGASITCDLRKNNLLSKQEAERLLTFTNNSGPLFIMGAVAVGMFKLPRAGYLLYLCHVAACLTVGFIFSFYKKSDKFAFQKRIKLSDKLKLELKKVRNSNINLSTLFGECIKNSVFTILAIGGFIIFFSVFINILLSSGFIGWLCGLLPENIRNTYIGSKTLEGILCGIFEITTGTNLINSSPEALQVKLCAASLIIGWAGISVHAQVMSIVRSTSDLSLKPYIIGKALQGIIASVYTFIGYTLFNKILLNDLAVFKNSSNKVSYQWNTIFSSSIQNIICICFIMLVITIIYVIACKTISNKKLL